MAHWRLSRMDRHVWISSLIILIASQSLAEDNDRWSKQISSYTADISDWVPVVKPIERDPDVQHHKRQAIAEPRILSEPFPGFSRPTGFSQDTFPPRNYFGSNQNRQLYLQSVPSAPHNFLNEPFNSQNLRLSLGQPDFPLNQGFIAQPFSFDSLTGQALPPQKSPSPVKYEQLSKPSKAKVIATHKRPEATKFVDGYRLENTSNSFKRPQSLQKVKQETNKFENFNQNVPKLPENFQTPRPANVDREEIQLLYVPVESLNRGQFNYKTPNAHIVNRDLFNPQSPKFESLSQPFFSNVPKLASPTRPTSLPPADIQRRPPSFQDYSLAQPALNDQIPKFTSLVSPLPSTNTPKPKKLKPHQPPLAVFVVQDGKKVIKVGDVLSTLKNARTIAVLDTVTPMNSPKVFIGPSTLHPPENYVKFDLPYLSNIENSDKKLRQLPFFVAPLSYSTPDGFAKIPFPSPHVGSVIVNAQIKESPYSSSPIADVIPNSYTASLPNQQVTTKPSFSYFSTVSPQTKPNAGDSQFFSFEPQEIQAFRPAEPSFLEHSQNKPTLFNNDDPKAQFQYVSFPETSNQANQEVTEQKYEDQFKFQQQSPGSTTTNEPFRQTDSTTTTPKAPSTFPAHLLQTHNPYSINQAFQFSSPLDYQNAFEENRNDFTTSTVSSQTPKLDDSTDKNVFQTPAYIQNYNPEIHYNAKDEINSHYPNHLSSNYGLTAGQAILTQTPNTINDSGEIQAQHEVLDDGKSKNKITTSSADTSLGQTTESSYIQNQYSTEAPSSTTSTTRRPLRARPRPRYTTTTPSEIEEPGKTSATRRPLRERRPSSSRPRYENKVTTERSTRRRPEYSSDSSTTKSPRTRTRGRIQFKPSDDEGVNKKYTKDEDDLAYQRDVLHQNYPVTIQERMSTVDIEAITEPMPNGSSKFLSNDPVSEISSEALPQELSSRFELDNTSELKETPEQTYPSRTATKNQVSQAFSSRAETKPRGDLTEFPTRAEQNDRDKAFTPRTETRETYVPNFSRLDNKDIHSSRLSTKSYQSDTFLSRNQQSIPKSPEEEFSPNTIRKEVQEESPQTTAHEQQSSFVSRTGSRFEQPVYYRSTTPISREDSTTTEKIFTNLEAEHYSTENLTKSEISSQIDTDSEITKVDNILQLTDTNKIYEDAKLSTEGIDIATTTSRSRLRTRPTIVKQQYTSTEATLAASTLKPAKNERKKPINAVTYRPSYTRRTTMRIEEIEQGLKTKQIHSRPEVNHDTKHPVYKPEPSTEPPTTTITDTTTRRVVQYRRRRPTSTPSTTENQTTKKTNYDNGSRFRGRRPTDKPSETNKITEQSVTTTRNLPYHRYNQRIKPSERFNRKPVSSNDQNESQDDQDTNPSINRPTFVPYEGSDPQWTSDTFRPYTPNDITGEEKSVKNQAENLDESDIITARNDYDDILISVTPASNRLNKKIPDIPPTLEAFVEQSKTTKSDASESISTFESVLEEVMKSLEEQDENEYSESVQKHEAGEIGEIPPERVITSDDMSDRTTVAMDAVTEASRREFVDFKKKESAKNKRRGYWKRVKVRPVTNSEQIDVAESQYYSKTVNHLGSDIKPNRNKHAQFEENQQTTQSSVTSQEKDYQNADIPNTTILPLENEKYADIEIPQSVTLFAQETTHLQEVEETTDPTDIQQEISTTTKKFNPGEMDLGTGTPDPTIMDILYSSPTTTTDSGSEDYSPFSLFENLFGFGSKGDEEPDKQTNTSETTTPADSFSYTESITNSSVLIDISKKIESTTENHYVPEEITSSSSIGDNDDDSIVSAEFLEIKKVNTTNSALHKEDITQSLEKNQEDPKLPEFLDSYKAEETATVSSFADPASAVSTSMSTEVSHETEICFRGKCIKTKDDIMP